jgi:hypothetical protein
VGCVGNAPTWSRRDCCSTDSTRSLRGYQPEERGGPSARAPRRQGPSANTAARRLTTSCQPLDSPGAFALWCEGSLPSTELVAPENRGRCGSVWETIPERVAGAGVEPAHGRLMRTLPCRLAPPHLQKWRGVSVLPRTRRVLEAPLRCWRPPRMKKSSQDESAPNCTDSDSCP